jgi:hypothetical protein
MHNNFETLQKKCQRYRFKKFIKRVLLPIFTLLLIVAGGYLYLDSEHQPTPLKSPTPKAAAVDMTKKEIQAAPNVEKKEAPVTVSPINAPVQKEDVQTTQHNSAVTRKDITYDLHVDTHYIPKHKISKVKKEPKKKAVIKKEPKKQTVSPTPPPKEISVITEPPAPSKPLAMSTKKFHSTKEMIQRFDNEQKYDLALKISQEFYDQEDFQKASLWAKKANILEREADGAWILYAKSEYARGNKKRAIEILRLYLANANSSEGESLLLNWLQGK